MLIDTFPYDSSPHSSGSGRSLCGVGCLSNNKRAENSWGWEPLRLWCCPESNPPSKRGAQKYAGAYTGGIPASRSLSYAFSCDAFPA
jgi:hypothetical protein